MMNHVYVIGPWQREITVTDEKGKVTKQPASVGLQTPLLLAEYSVARADDVTGQDSRGIPRLPCDLVVHAVWCDDKTLDALATDERFKVFAASDMGKPPEVAAVPELEAWLGKAGMAEAAIGRVTGGAKSGGGVCAEIVQKIVTETGGKARLTTAVSAVVASDDMPPVAVRARRR